MAQSLNEPLIQATALTVLGFTYSSSSQYAKAVSSYEQGLSVLQGREDQQDRTMKAALFTGLALNYVLVGEQKRGFSYFEKALTLKRELKDPGGEAQVLTAMGATYLQVGQSEKALEFDNRALAIARSVRDKTIEAMALGALGGAYRELGQNEKALECFNQELNLRQADGNESSISVSLNRIAGVYLNMADTVNAYKYFKQALQIKRDSSTLNNLGQLYAILGEFEQARSCYDEALSLTQADDDRIGQAATLSNIGALYLDLGEPQNAIDYYNRALPLMQAMNNPSGEASIVGLIGTALLGAGRKEEALTHYNRALQLSRGADRFGEVNALIQIGNTYSELGRKTQALNQYNLAMPIARTINDRLAIATIINNSGDIYRSTGQLKKALDSYEQALVIVREVGDRIKEVSTLGNIATTQKEMGDLAGSRTSIESALVVVELLRTKIGSQDLRSSFFAKEHSYYEFEIDLLMDLHKRSPAERLDLAALQIAERSRARSLYELLVESHANIRQGVDSQLLGRERSLQLQINAKEFARLRISRIPNTGEQATILAKETDALINELRQVDGQIRQSSPRYAELTQFKPLDVKEVQAQLDSETLLLEYSLGTPHSYLWVVSQTGLKSFALPAAKEINQAAQRFIEVLHGSTDFYSSDEPQAQTDNIVANAWRLSTLLLGPVASQLGEKRLVIVADDILQAVPFAALPDISVGKPGAANLQPLILRHEIVSAPSLSTLATLHTETNENKSWSKELFVLADPVFYGDDERMKPTAQNERKQQSSPVKIKRNGKQLERLKGSRTEAEGIRSLLPAIKVTTAMDFDASRSFLSSVDLGQYRYVHFATHGLIDTRRPELTSIVLSLVDETGAPQDGFYRAHEVYNLRLGADLVVLSACDTGSGKIVKGEGLIGLTRGFMYAGAKRVMVSLWAITDESTPDLMVSFYKKIILEGKRPAEALRAAQIEMWKGDKWKAPHYWAGFVLQGEWR
jgi:CHAT domain-containing protein/Tfp pilus assembly protein PilF